MTTIGNFSSGYMISGLYSSGYFDPWNVDTSDISDSDQFAKIDGMRKSLSTYSGDTITYNFLYRPPMGILNSTKPLLPNSELIITFDRANSDLSLIAKPDTDTDNISNTVLDIKTVYLKANYYTSPFLRNYFSTITKSEIVYNYDEISIYHKSLPQG